MPTQPDLLDRISAFPLELPAAGFSFLARLQAETGWTRQFALEAISEYKKFIYLISIGERRLVPSAIVDEVWHTHLLWTENYWEQFCEGTIGRRIHHRPSGEGQGPELLADYTATLDLYAAEFGDAAPRSFWPDPGAQPSIRSVDTDAFFVLSKLHAELTALALVAAGILLVGWYQTWEGRKILGLLAVIAALVYLFARKEKFDRSLAGKSDRGCGGGCGGSGCGGH